MGQSESEKALTEHYSSEHAGPAWGWGVTVAFSWFALMIAGYALSALTGETEAWFTLTWPLFYWPTAVLTNRYRGWSRRYRWIRPDTLSVFSWKIPGLPFMHRVEEWKVESSRVVGSKALARCCYEIELVLKNGDVRRIRTMVELDGCAQLEKLKL